MSNVFSLPQPGAVGQSKAMPQAALKAMPVVAITLAELENLTAWAALGASAGKRHALASRFKQRSDEAAEVLEDLGFEFPYFIED